jgi:hypothetical protein
MKHLVRNTVILLATLFLPVMALVPAYAANPQTCGNSNTSKGQVLQGVGQSGSNCDDAGVEGAISAVIRILSLIAGIAAIIMVVYAGLKYITSGGDASKIGTAKNTLIYALVGVAIAALAQFLVHFVFTAATESQKSPSSSSSPGGSGGKTKTP